MKDNIKKQISTVLQHICSQFYTITRAKEKASMPSKEIQTMEIKNGPSVRSLEIKIETLRKEIAHKVSDN